MGRVRGKQCNNLSFLKKTIWRCQVLGVECGVSSCLAVSFIAAHRCLRGGAQTPSWRRTDSRGGARMPSWLMNLWAAVRGLSCFESCGILVPWPGIKPVSHALQGRFLTAEPTGKSPSVIVISHVFISLFLFSETIWIKNNWARIPVTWS